MKKILLSVAMSAAMLFGPIQTSQATGCCSTICGLIPSLIVFFSGNSKVKNAKKKLAKINILQARLEKIERTSRLNNNELDVADKIEKNNIEEEIMLIIGQTFLSNADIHSYRSKEESRKKTGQTIRLLGALGIPLSLLCCCIECACVATCASGLAVRFSPLQKTGAGKNINNTFDDTIGAIENIFSGKEGSSSRSD